MRLAVRSVKRAVGRPYRAAQARVARALFERRGVDTGGQAQLSEFGVDAPGRNRYEPSGYSYLRRALRGVPVRPGDVFVDYGSGKGRIVLQAASRHPFARVIGVEIADELTRVARANLAGVRDRLRCRDVELITADAELWPLPDDVTHVYLYNSVTGEAFRAVLAQIVASLQRRRRRLVFMYANPLFDADVLATGHFARVRVSRGLRPDVFSRRIHVYESVAGGAG